MLAAGANDAGRANAETDVPGDTHGRWGWGGSDGRSRGFGRGIGIVRSGRPRPTSCGPPARGDSPAWGLARREGPVRLRLRLRLCAPSWPRRVGVLPVSGEPTAGKFSHGRQRAPRSSCLLRGPSVHGQGCQLSRARRPCCCCLCPRAAPFAFHLHRPPVGLRHSQICQPRPWPAGGCPTPAHGQFKVR
jgi:hypothetical protein